MTDLFFGTSDYDRTRGNFPALPVINMFAEQAPTEQGLSLQSRPGINNTGTSMGVGPVKALFQNDGVLSGALLGISDTKLYESATNRGAINGTGPAKLAGFEGFVFANAGDDIWKWNGAALAAVATPGAIDAIDICVGSSRLIFIEKDTGRFWWSDPLTATIDPLSFATAENSPDRLKACLYIGDTLILFGSKTVEFWPVTTDPDAPFQPLVGRVFQRGIRGIGCAAEFNSTFAWITDNNQVCMSDPQSVISQSDLDAKISASTTAALWTFFLEGIEFLAVRLDDSTHVFSSRSQQWSNFESYGQTNFIPQCYANNTFGSSVDGHLIAWTTDHSDFSDVLERRFRAGASLDAGTTRVDNLAIRTNPGQTPFLVGDYATPVVELRTSKDGGFQFSVWRDKSLGAEGKYRQYIQWRSLGNFGYPGLLVEVRVTDPVPFRVSKMVMNEPYGNI